MFTYCKPMAHYSSILERLFYSLAEDLSYPLTQDEIGFYVKELASFGLKPISHALLALREDKRPTGSFPSVSEFKRQIKELKRVWKNTLSSISSPLKQS